jgi:hypothetical protein
MRFSVHTTQQPRTIENFADFKNVGAYSRGISLAVSLAALVQDDFSGSHRARDRLWPRVETAAIARYRNESGLSHGGFWEGRG